MSATPRAALLLTAALAACGGNVIVDGSPSGTGTGAVDGSGGDTAGTAGTGFGGGPGMTTTGTGFGGGVTTTGTGFGGGVTTTGTGFGGSDATVSSSIATTTGAGGAAGACLDGSDKGVLDDKVIWPAIAACGQKNLTNMGANQACIASATDLTDACTACVADELIPCTLQHCVNDCAANPEGLKCAACRQSNCEGAFEACSGVVQPGTAACSTLYGTGPNGGSTWPAPIPVSELLTQAAYTAYTALDSCACADKVGGTPPGCEDLCFDTWCSNLPASPSCAQCLDATCGVQIKNCEAN